MILLHSPLMLKGRTMLAQRNKVKEDRDSKKEASKYASIVTGLATMLESVLIKRILHEMMTTTTTTAPISKPMSIKGITGSTTKERGMLPLLDMEMVNLPKGRETTGMRKLML